MLKKASDIKAILPEEVKKDFDDIVNQVVLGASNHIKMIGKMIESIALEGKTNKNSVEDIVKKIKDVTDFFIATRGEASQAISNAIYIMIKGLNKYSNEDSLEEVVEKIIETKDNYARGAKTAIEEAVSYAVNLAKNMENIFVYDYSSTVEKFLRDIAKNNKKYTIYIAESRIIDGGYPFVKACKEANHNIKFVPDASIMHSLKKCDAAFMGAETFFADGTGFNTTGSDIVGLVCNYYKIPLYFLTPMVKLDVRPIYGGIKTIVYDDLEDKLSKNWDKEIDTSSIDFVTPELIGVPPEHIEGFITELGIIPSRQMYGISLQYNNSMKGE